MSDWGGGGGGEGVELYCGQIQIGNDEFYKECEVTHRVKQ